MVRQSDLIRNTLLTLSFRHRKEELEDHYPSVLALLSYSPVGMEEGFQSIRNLRKEKVRLRLWIDETLTSFYKLEDIVKKTESDDICSHHSAEHSPSFPRYLFIPILSYSLVSKVLNHDDSHPFSRMILETLFRGGKVVAISQAADPYHPSWKEKGYDKASPLMKHEMRSRLMQLKGYGVEILQPQQLDHHWLRKEKQWLNGKKLVSQEVVLQAYASQNYIMVVDDHTIITPLARDLAKQFGIEFRRGDGG